MKAKDFNDVKGTLEFLFNCVDRNMKTQKIHMTDLPNFGDELRRKCREKEDEYRSLISEFLTEKQKCELTIVYGQWLNKRNERIRNGKEQV